MKITTASLDAEQNYKLMMGVVVPRPIAWISSASSSGKVNLAPFSCFTVVSNKPPMLGVSIGHRAGVRKDTARNIRELGEFVVNIASQDLLNALHQSAVEYEPDVSEIEVLGLDTIPSESITVPRLADVPVSLECRLHSITPFGDSGNEFHVGEVLVVHVHDDLIQDHKIETAALRPISRLAGPNYAHLGEIITLSALQLTPKALMPKQDADKKR